MEAAKDESFGTTIINVAEQVKGWLAAVNKERQAVRQVTAYRELARLFDFYASYHIALFNEMAALRFNDLTAFKASKPRQDVHAA